MLKLKGFAVIFSKLNSLKLSKQNEEGQKFHFYIFLLELSLNAIFSYDIFQEKIIPFRIFHPALLLSDTLLLRKYLIP